MIFEKIREMLYESEDRYDDVAYSQLSEFGRTLDYEYARGKCDGITEAIGIINQVEAEYTCENCAEKGKCAICDNFNIKFCSDLRPIIAPPPYIPKGE